MSELVTNALRHAPGPGGLLLELLTGERDLLRITVRDTSPTGPSVCPPDPLRVGRHGVHLVTRLCATFATIPVTGGKAVVAELRLSDTVREGAAPS
ncbi:ATP-binding protein [Streptomyces sp. NPDC004830]